MHKADVDACSAPHWLPIFKQQSFRYRLIDLPKDFIKAVLADSVLLPKQVDDDDDGLYFPHFPQLEDVIETAIAELKGSVYPKLNWSAPKDASWLQAGNTLECRSYCEILTLLQGSDDVLRDLLAPYLECEDIKGDCELDDAVLVLKRWENVRRSHEFRVLVNSGYVVGISQRHTGIFFRNLAEDINELKDVIIPFVNDVVIPQFPSKSFCIDLYIERLKNASWKPWIVDFSPWGKPTDPLLLDWDQTSFVFAVIEKESDVRVKICSDALHARDMMEFA